MPAAFLTLLLTTALPAAEPPITAAAFSPDGKSIVVGSQSGIRQLGWPEFEEQRSLATELSHVHDLRFSPDGQRLAAVGGIPAESGGIEIFRWPERQLLHRRMAGEDVVYQLSWRGDSEALATAGPDLEANLFDRSAKPLARVAGHSRTVTTIALLPGGYFVSGSRDQTLRVWREADRELVRTLNNHTNAVRDMAVRPGSTKVPYVLASSSDDKTIRLWWPVRGRLMRFAKLPSPALDICWTPDGESILAACADGHFRVIDPDTVQVTQDIEVTNAWLHTVAASPVGKQAFVGGSNGLRVAIELDER